MSAQTFLIFTFSNVLFFCGKLFYHSGHFLEKNFWSSSPSVKRFNFFNIQNMGLFFKLSDQITLFFQLKNSLQNCSNRRKMSIFSTLRIQSEQNRCQRDELSNISKCGERIGFNFIGFLVGFIFMKNSKFGAFPLAFLWCFHLPGFHIFLDFHIFLHLNRFFFGKNNLFQFSTQP